MDIEERIKMMKKYVEDLRNEAAHDPRAARRWAKKNLMGAGIVNRNGKPKYPYNGEKPRGTDFTRGPGEMSYSQESTKKLGR